VRFNRLADAERDYALANRLSRVRESSSSFAGTTRTRESCWTWPCRRKGAPAIPARRRGPTSSWRSPRKSWETPLGRD
jgi:hypothetical protein